MSEVVTLCKDEWEAYLTDGELLVERYEELTEKLKKLREENSTLQQKLRSAEERLRTLDKKLSVGVQESSQTL